MKATSITITGDDLAAGVDALLAALEPADLAALESAANRMSRFYAFACQLLAPLPTLPPPDLIPPEDALAALDAPYPSLPAIREAHPRSNAEVAKINRLAVARALAGGPLRQAEIVAATGISQGTVTGVIKAGLPTGCGWWRRVDTEDRNSGYELTGQGWEPLKTEGYIVPVWAAPDAPTPARDEPQAADASARDRARCVIVAGTLAKLLVPLAAFTIARESGLNADDVEKRLLRNPQWFERADCVGIKYKLTHKGRELAAEGEVTS